MNKINETNSMPIIGYRGLIYLHQEKDFVNKTTRRYYDNDIDLWIFLQAAKHVTELEKDLFSLFG